MDRSLYIDKAIELEYHLELGWLRTILGIPKGNSLYFKDDHYLLDGEEVIKSNGKPLLYPEDEITISGLSNIKDSVTTTVGTFIFNTIVDRAYLGKIDYINEEVDMGDFAKRIVRFDHLTEKEWVEGLKRFVIGLTFITKLSPLVVKTVNKELLSPPPGIDKFRNELKKEMIAKYGEDNFRTSTAAISEYREKLVAYDREYLKPFKDEGYISASGKIANVSRVGYHLTGGQAFSLDGTGKLLDTTLEGGIEMTEENYALAINEIRKGSSDRGSETQLAGVIASILGRATQSYTIEQEYCGTKDGEIVHGDDPRLIDSYILKDGKPYGPITKEEFPLKGDVLYMSPRSCKSKGLTYCKKCVGLNMARAKYNIGLASATTGGNFLNLLMKGMHDPSIRSIEIDALDMFS